MVYFVGAGPGSSDLVTLRGKQLIEEADVILYAGSLINRELLDWRKADCIVHDSATMCLEECVAVMRQAEAEKKCTVRLHSGDPCLYGAIREQMDALDSLHIPYASVPGVSSFCAAAAALNLEYTVPGMSQSVIITRLAGRTPVPASQDVESFVAHRATMVFFLSAGLLEEMQRKLLAGGCSPQTPAAIVYKASWPEQQVYRCTVADLAESARRHHISQTALIIVGDVLGTGTSGRSCLYDASFSTAYRQGRPQ